MKKRNQKALKKIKSKLKKTNEQNKQLNYEQNSEAKESSTKTIKDEKFVSPNNFKVVNFSF